MNVLMPVITEAGEDGVVTAWMVDDGGRVKSDQLIAEVQAEKVAEEVRSPGDGVVRDQVPINQPVPQGEPICRLVEGPAGEAVSEEGVAVVAAASPVAAGEAARIVATPSAKRVARELGVDLAGLVGSGPGGRITEADVEAAASPSPAGTELTGLRAVIARNMRQSAAETAAVTLTTTVDVTAMSTKHVTARIVRAVALALADHPAIHGTRDGDRFTPAATAHVAIAVQTDDGLVAPVVRDPARASVDEVAADIARLAEGARSRQLTMDDYEAATFTVSNLGQYGIDAFTPIINPPQVAILGVGAIRQVPRIDRAGAVTAGRAMVLSLTFDHAFVDGAPAAEFLDQLRSLLEAEEE